MVDDDTTGADNGRDTVLVVVKSIFNNNHIQIQFNDVHSDLGQKKKH